jgi:hypothetical protein
MYREIENHHQLRQADHVEDAPPRRSQALSVEVASGT